MTSITLRLGLEASIRSSGSRPSTTTISSGVAP